MVWASLVVTHQNGLSPTTLRSLRGKPRRSCRSIIVIFLFILFRGLPTGIHATNGPGTCHYVLEDSKSNVVLVENQKQLDKILQVDKI